MGDLKSGLLEQFQLIHVPEEVLGQKVYVQQLSAQKAESYQLARMDTKTGKVDFTKFGGARADLVALCLCEEDGTLMFKNGVEAGGCLPTTFIDAAYKVCARVNGMSSGEAEEEEDLGND